MKEFEVVPTDPIVKLSEELENLRTEIKRIKVELSESVEQIKKEISKPFNNNLLEKNLQGFSNNYLYNSDREFYKEIINSLVKSNIELQAKLSELIVVSTNLYKEIKDMLTIFKEAALMYSSGKKQESKMPMELIDRLNNLEKSNLKIAEILDKLNKSIDSLKDTINKNTITSSNNIPKYPYNRL